MALVATSTMRQLAEQKRAVTEQANAAFEKVELAQAEAEGTAAMKGSGIQRAPPPAH